MARSRKRTTGGSLWAILGCGCGTIAMIGILCIFVLLQIQFARERKDPHWNAQSYAICARQMHYLGIAIQSYEQDHHQLPPTLDALKDHYLPTAAWLSCPLHLAGKSSEYQYDPTHATHPTDPLITCNNHREGPIILQRNGMVHLKNTRQW